MLPHEAGNTSGLLVLLAGYCYKVMASDSRFDVGVVLLYKLTQCGVHDITSAKCLCAKVSRERSQIIYDAKSSSKGAFPWRRSAPNRRVTLSTSYLSPNVAPSDRGINSPPGSVHALLGKRCPTSSTSRIALPSKWVTIHLQSTQSPCLPSQLSADFSRYNVCCYEKFPRRNCSVWRVTLPPEPTPTS